MTNNQQHFEELVASIDGAELGNLFGKQCGKINKKAFVAFFQDEMVFKLGRETVDELKYKYEGSQNWDPSGKKRPMKDWLQVPNAYPNDWKILTKKATMYFEESQKT